MPTLRNFYPATVAALLVLMLPALSGVGCAASSDSATGAAPAVSDPVAPTKSVRGGVTYDPATALNAQVTPTYDTKTPPSLYYTYSVRYSGGDGVTVPGIFTVPVTPSGKFPCVILLHGLGGRKEDMFLLSVALARKGYATFAIDIAGHGERPKIDGKPISDLNLGEMRTVAGQTTADLRRSVDFLSTRSEIDSKRIGFLGASLGGILGAVFVGDEARIKGAVLWAAGGDWGKLITTSQHAFAQKFRQSGDTDATKIEDTMRDVDPLYTIGNVAPRPLLFINGDKDTVVPTTCTDALVTAAKDPKKRLTLSGGHIPDLGVMLNESLNWFEANLK